MPLPLPAGQEALERAIAERRPVAMPGARTVSAPDGSGVAHAGGDLPDKVGLADGSVLAVPLLVKGEIYGGFVTYYAYPRQVSEEETKLAATLADHAALAIENSRLRTQARQTAVMAERSRLARGLHDSVTQGLYSMMLFAEATSMAMSAGKIDVATKNLDQLRVIAREAVLDMRILIFELHPPILEEKGLVAALQARLSTVEARAGVHAEVEVAGERRLALLVEDELFWVAREALNNAVKHAKAAHVMVRLCFGDEDVSMEIRDDGQGFDSAGAGPSSGVGLRGIEERVQRIGGTLEIASVPGEGTTLKVRVRA
jgi:signal transduction histidine kinase